MNEMDSAIVQTVFAMWDSVVGEPLVVSECEAVRGQGLVGCIHVTGEMGGVVTIECSHELARQAAAGMFQLPLADVHSGDAEDSLGELTNIVGGNFKALLSEGHHLSLPTVVEGRDFRTRFIGTSLASRVSFSASGEPFTVSFFREGPAFGNRVN